jgi:hypothetical protein
MWVNLRKQTEREERKDQKRGEKYGITKVRFFFLSLNAFKGFTVTLHYFGVVT